MLSELAERLVILCVHRELSVLDGLARTLGELGEVLRVSGEAEALACLRARPVHLLVVHHQRPVESALRLVAAARAEGHHFTAVAIVDGPDGELARAVEEGGLFRLVTLPWRDEELVMTARNALAYEQLRRDRQRLLTSLHKRSEALTVMYEVSRQSASAPTLDAIVDRLLATVGRVLPHEVSGVLLESSDGQTASLRIRCNAAATDAALVSVKDALVAAHRRTAERALPEERLMTNVGGPVAPRLDGLSSFEGSVIVPLASRDRHVGTLGLFSSSADRYSSEDGELLDLLVNQTTDAIGHVHAVERDARLRIEQMVEAMGDGVVLTDESGRVLVANAAARGLLGLEGEGAPPTLEQLSAALGFSPFDVARGRELSPPAVLVEELALGERHVGLQVRPVLGEERALRGVMVVLHDVTEERHLAQRKEEFVGVVSHELRTPLTSIIGGLDLVLNNIAGELNERQRRFLSMARESTERLNALVDDLLDFARFERGAMRMSFEVTHLDDLVASAVEKHAVVFNAKGITVALEVARRGLKILADPGRLVQVLDNLLTNAAKFTPAHGHVRVTVGRPGETPGSVVLSVWNSGDPIAEADRERIFDRFEQARTPKNRGIPGTGLGLAICRAIVQAHGGHVWCEPEPSGACFVVVLPDEPPSEERPSPPPMAAGRGGVLIVEDSPQLAWLMKARLLMAGYRVDLACTGEDALVLARGLRPEVIILDQGLPDIEGLRLLEIFRHDPETKGARVLFVSGQSVREEAMRAGAAGFLQKPIDTASLLSALEAVLRARRGGHGRILVVDDDPRIAAICAEVLSNQGYEVDQAGTLAEARLALLRAHTELMLLDVGLPDGDGFEFFETLKEGRAVEPPSVIFLSARAETAAKVRALKLGADDYLTKPFDAVELGARVERALKRRSAQAQASPSTQLPASAAIEREVRRRAAEATPFAFCYLDLDNLKAFNDYYGFAKADGVVRQTADLMRAVVTQLGDGSEFIGHIGGDDFVIICATDRIDAIGHRFIESFDRIIPLYYERQDRERGYIEAEDRFGQRRQFPIMSVSAVSVIAQGRVDHAELARRAAGLKQRAKAHPGSIYLRAEA